MAILPIRAESAALVAVVLARNASLAEKLAGKEVRRYIYLRTDELLPILDDFNIEDNGQWIVIGTKDRPTVQALLSDQRLKAVVDGLASQQYMLKTLRHNGRSVLLIVGGDAVGTLYGAYSFVEHLGVRFYLDGDVVPDEPISLELSDLDETGKPLFALRGILPFHDFPEGPDLWNLDDYRAVLAQMVKLRMNFIGLHTYSECGWGTEPTVWIGLPDDVACDGSVRFSPASHYFNTARSASGHTARKTNAFGFGAAQLFADESFGPDVMRGLMPWGATLDQRNEIYQRAGVLLREAFRSAHALGVRTCVGTEMPLSRFASRELKNRLGQQGKNLNDPAVLRELYRGTFLRAMKTYPLDYYWLWTSESWRLAVADAVVEDVERNLLAAVEAAKEIEAPFTLATAGWALGPNKNRALYDRILPKWMPFSCLNLELGTVPVDPAFARIEGRPKWVISWLENDLSMSTPQKWVGRVRKDAMDARKYGCTGLIGIHWRTRNVGPEAAALAVAGWDQSGWNNLGTSVSEVNASVEVVGGQTASSDALIADTNDDVLYQSVRYNVSSYRLLKVPDGKYTVKLQFCEPVYNKPGKRVFGVTLQGNVVIKKLDIFTESGLNRALNYTFRDIAATDGQIEISFLKDRSAQFMKEARDDGREGLKGYSCIAAVVVEGPGYLRKINCGGGAYRDYQGDPAANPRHRYAPTGDFYLDWAACQFGVEVARPAAEMFEVIDGNLPTPAPLCPGGIQVDGRPWSEVEKSYAFVDDLARLRSQITGVGNRERFDYWLGSFRYLKAVGRVACRLAEMDRAMERVKHVTNTAKKKQLARSIVGDVPLIVKPWMVSS